MRVAIVGCGTAGPGAALLFQSDLTPIGWARDALLEPISRIPWVRRQFVTTFMGARTSPWTTWRPPD